jgi:multimeric flavodoxin WrbA
MKVLGIVGSLRKHGNTDLLLDSALQAAASCNMETKKIYLSDYQFGDCIGCQRCKDCFSCAVKDEMQKIYRELESVDAIILGSPTYFYNVTGLTKNFLDRLYVYNVFDSSDRSVWSSLFEITGIRYAVTIAVCEQQDESDMGFTSPAMDKALQAVGYRVVESVKVMHLFSKGEAANDEKALRMAANAGKKLAKVLLLSQKVKQDVSTPK